MNDEFTNLLPLERQKIVRNRYFTRLAVVAVVVATALVGAAAALLIPIYVLLSQNVVEKENRLSMIQGSIPDVNQKELSARLVALTSNTKVLTELATAPMVEKLLQTILEVSHVGITLNSFTYTPKKTTPKNIPGVLVVNGVSQTRDTLRAYQLALQGVPFVTTAALPVSAYALSGDIPFSITLTLKP